MNNYCGRKIRKLRETFKKFMIRRRAAASSANLRETLFWNAPNTYRSFHYANIKKESLKSVKTNEFITRLDTQMNKFYKINLSKIWHNRATQLFKVAFVKLKNLHYLKIISCPFPFPWANVGNFLNNLRSIFQQNNEKSEETIALFIDSTSDASERATGNPERAR